MNRRLLFAALVLLLAAVLAAVWIARDMQRQLHAPLTVSAAHLLLPPIGTTLVPLGPIPMICTTASSSLAPS